MLPTLGVADEMNPFRGLFHDGGHSLSKPLYLLPQGPQALSAIEEIKHCHHSSGVCLWEGGNAATGVGLRRPPAFTVHARARNPVLLTSPRQHQYPEELALEGFVFQLPKLPPPNCRYSNTLQPLCPDRPH